MSSEKKDWRSVPGVTLGGRTRVLRRSQRLTGSVHS